MLVDSIHCLDKRQIAVVKHVLLVQLLPLVLVRVPVAHVVRFLIPLAHQFVLHAMLVRLVQHWEQLVRPFVFLVSLVLFRQPLVPIRAPFAYHAALARIVQLLERIVQAHAPCVLKAPIYQLLEQTMLNLASRVKLVARRLDLANQALLHVHCAPLAHLLPLVQAFAMFAHLVHLLATMDLRIAHHVALENFLTRLLLQVHLFAKIAQLAQLRLQHEQHFVRHVCLDILVPLWEVQTAQHVNEDSINHNLAVPLVLHVNLANTLTLLADLSAKFALPVRFPKFSMPHRHPFVSCAQKVLIQHFLDLPSANRAHQADIPLLVHRLANHALLVVFRTSLMPLRVPHANLARFQHHLHLLFVLCVH